MFSRAAIIVVAFDPISPALTQSVPGAAYLAGGGTPGAQYSLVDDYEPTGFFDKFNFFNVCSTRIISKPF